MLMLNWNIKTVSQLNFEVFYGLIVMTCQILDGDKGKHVYDRFLIVSCDNVIPPEERDPELLEKLLAEKEIIVSVAIKY